MHAFRASGAVHANPRESTRNDIGLGDAVLDGPCCMLAMMSGAIATQGFVFASTAEGDPMARAVVGEPVHGEHDAPPWIVVSHTLRDVLVSRWPGRLWRVEILRPADEQPLRGAGYTRAVAVKVIEELPPAVLFGPHGTEVCRVISVAERISQYDADRLQSRRSDDADAAYTRAWK